MISHDIISQPVDCIPGFCIYNIHSKIMSCNDAVRRDRYFGVGNVSTNENPINIYCTSHGHFSPLRKGN